MSYHYNLPNCPAFELSYEQVKTINKWINQQKRSRGGSAKPDLSKPHSCIGGEISYIFTPTSLGVVIKVVDNVTKEELDVTEYDRW